MQRGDCEGPVNTEFPTFQLIGTWRGLYITNYNYLCFFINLINEICIIMIQLMSIEVGSGYGPKRHIQNHFSLN